MLVKERKNKKRRFKSSVIITSSFLLILINVTIPLVKYYSIYELKHQEEIKVDYFIDNMKSNEDINIDSQDANKEKVITSSENYSMVLEIPTINLRKGIYNKESIENNIEKNVTILSDSDLPSNENGNVILVAHSGNGYKAFFNDLIKLKINDFAYLYFEGSRFSYKLVNTYEVEKTGEVNIKRNFRKNTLTLITCKKNENKQLVFIFEQ